MTEPGPVSFGLLAGAVALAGPVLGPYALIVFAAGVGSALALSVEAPSSRWAGLRFLAVGSLVALCITGPIVWAIQHYLGIPGNIALVPVAFVLGAGRSQLLSLIKQVLDGVAAAAGAFLNRGNRGGQ